MAIRPFVPCALVAIAAALALPAPALADHGPAFLDDRLATFMGIAQDHWGGPAPTCTANGTTVIGVHAVLYDDPEPDVAGRADQPGCRLSLDRSHWRSMGRVEACTIVVHEWGHLLGHEHVADPLDLMAEFPERPPAACAALRRPVRAAARSAARRARFCARRSLSWTARHRFRAPLKQRFARRACVRRVRARA
jgi:hypothetical protein